jgi:hypothetical protein
MPQDRARVGNAHVKARGGLRKRLGEMAILGTFTQSRPLFIQYASVYVQRPGFEQSLSVERRCEFQRFPTAERIGPAMRTRAGFHGLLFVQ